MICEACGLSVANKRRQNARATETEKAETNNKETTAGHLLGCRGIGIAAHVDPAKPVVFCRHNQREAERSRCRGYTQSKAMKRDSDRLP